jgi:hypothetical protein
MKRSLAIALGLFILLRLIALPRQIAHTPYNDYTVMADILRVTFLKVPNWVMLTSAIAFVLSYLLMRFRAKTAGRRRDN